MKKGIIIFTVLLSLLGEAVPGFAQTGYREFGGKYMEYFVDGKDTVYLSPIAAARVYDKRKRGKGREWRRYYRLVHNFAKVYPYALLASKIVSETSDVIKTQGLARNSKDVYINSVINELFRNFEQPLRKLTISQGELLMKLIDRECGFTPYEIIVEFKNRFTAGFWQGVAWLFGEDLKREYDPKGKDEDVEDLVLLWKEGSFDRVYYEIFWEYPPKVVIPEKYR